MKKQEMIELCKKYRNNEAPDSQLVVVKLKDLEEVLGIDNEYGEEESQTSNS